MATILVADDDAHVVRLMSLWLSRHGHRVLEARNAAGAAGIIADHTIDMVISDVNMPGGGGLELLRITREEHGLDVPFLLITSRCDQRELAAKAQAYSASVYPKPFVPSRLVEQIAALLAGRGGQGEGSDPVAEEENEIGYR